MFDSFARYRPPARNHGRAADAGAPAVRGIVEQTFATIAPYTIEEAYEVADAIARGDLADLRDELGDLLLQVAFHARMAQEQGAFDFGGVVEAITAKMIRRHPHVFGDARDLSPGEVKALWGEIKAAEKAARPERAAGGAGGRAGRHAGADAGAEAAGEGRQGRLRLERRQAPCWRKSARRSTRSRRSSTRGGSISAEGEVGDLLFVVVNLARHLKADPEAALRGANAKFERRFGFIEAALARKGRRPEQATLAEMDALWDEAKRGERE